MIWCTTAPTHAGLQRDNTVLNEEWNGLLLNYYVTDYQVRLRRKLPMGEELCTKYGRDEGSGSRLGPCVPEGGLTGIQLV